VRARWAAIGLALAGTLSAAGVGMELGEGVTVTFLTGEDGGKFLATPDDFVKSLSPFDRSVRLRVGRAVGQEEFLKHVWANAIDWTGRERKRLRLRLGEIRDQLKGLKLPWPKTIFFIKTTGKEEGDAAYTRRNAVVLAASKLPRNDELLRRLLVHELFHVLSRHNPKLATRLYAIIGYEPAPSLKFPAELAARKLTNPDAPFNRHAIEVEHAGQKVKVMPILYSRVEKFDEVKGGTLFRYLVFRLLVLDAKDLSKAARDDEGKLILLQPDEAKGFHKKIGRNTGYIIHPEETMADNFVYLVLGKKNLPNPEIVEKMRAMLGGKGE
jgi:hypothetical protein